MGQWSNSFVVFYFEIFVAVPLLVTPHLSIPMTPPPPNPSETPHCSTCHNHIPPISKNLKYIPVIVSKVHEVMESSDSGMAPKETLTGGMHNERVENEASDTSNVAILRATHPALQRLRAKQDKRRIVCKRYSPKAPQYIDFFSPIYDAAVATDQCLACFSEHHTALRCNEHNIHITYIPVHASSSRALKFKWTPHATKYSVVSGILKRHGFQKVQSHDPDYNIMWGLHASEPEYYRLNPHQRVNHWLGSTNLGRKDLLAINLDRARNLSDSKEDWDFHPRSYFFPRDREKLIAKMNMKKQHKMWIVKPRASACGRDISVTSNLYEVDRQRECLVQEYIERPFTIDGKKFDLRLYVLVTSYNPLVIYIYSSGLVRFASEKYSPTSTNIFAALTNYSLNKKSDKFVKNTDALQDDVGNKWTCTALRKWFRSHGIEDVAMWQQTYDIIVKTLIAVESRVNALTSQYVLPENRNSCFELYGFDILLDETLKPHLVEVNIGPSLSTGSPLDKMIKSKLIRNILQVSGVEPYDREQLKQEKQALVEISKLSASLDYSIMNLLSKFTLQSFKNNRKAVVEERPCTRTLAELKALQSLDYLTVHDKNVILDLESAYSRRQDFIRLFPTVSSEQKYRKFFMEDSYNNLLLFLWMRESPERQRELMQLESPYTVKRHAVKALLSSPRVPRPASIQESKIVTRRTADASTLSQSAIIKTGGRPSSSLRLMNKRAASSMDLRRSRRNKYSSPSLLPDEVVPETDDDNSSTHPSTRRSKSSMRLRELRRSSKSRSTCSVLTTRRHQADDLRDNSTGTEQNTMLRKRSYNYIRDTFRFVYS